MYILSYVYMYVSVGPPSSVGPSLLSPSETQCVDVKAVGAARNGRFPTNSCFDPSQRCTAWFYNAELSKFANAS